MFTEEIMLPESLDEGNIIFRVVTFYAVTIGVATIVCTSPACGSYSATDAGNLEDAILTNYHTMVRPSEHVQVNIDIGIYHISSLSTIDQELSLVGFLILEWNDTRLTWTEASYGNISVTYLKSSQIWTPPITLANSADGIRMLSDDTDTESIPLVVDSGGEVTWLAAANYLVKCNVDITYYPFDSQTCYIKVSTWMYGAADLGLVNAASEVNLQLYEDNGEWDLISTRASAGFRTLHGHPMSMVEFSVNLNRKHSYYILNMILPVVFTSLLGCLVFLLPIESGEKNGFALTILLSLSVIMTIVSDKIPPTSTHVCILSVYLLCALSICVIEVLVTVFIQRIHSKTSNEANVDGKLQKVAGFLAKIARHKITIDDDYTDNVSMSTPRSLKKTKIFPDDLRHQSDVKLEILTNKPKGHTGKKAENAIEKKIRSEAWPVLYDYKDISVCLDKICFYVFFLFTVVLTLVFLLILAEG